MNNTKQTKRATPTPGPWALVKKTTPGQFGTDYQIRTPENYLICEIGPNAQDENARLIAAAPEMLEALINLRDNFDYPPAAYEVILNAIAKAEGRES